MLSTKTVAIAMYNKHKIGAPSSCTWSKDEEGKMWEETYMAAKSCGYSDERLAIIKALECDAKGHTRDMSVTWTAEQYEAALLCALVVRGVSVD